MLANLRKTLTAGVPICGTVKRRVKAHRLLYHATLGLGVITKRRRRASAGRSSDHRQRGGGEGGERARESERERNLGSRLEMLDINKPVSNMRETLAAVVRPPYVTNRNA